MKERTCKKEKLERHLLTMYKPKNETLHGKCHLQVLKRLMISTCFNKQTHTGIINGQRQVKNVYVSWPHRHVPNMDKDFCQVGPVTFASTGRSSFHSVRSLIMSEQKSSIP